MHRKKQGRLASYYSLIATFLVFAVVLGVLLSGTKNLSSAASEEGVAATHQAIERAAVVCYATEGFYPPGIQYIEKNYGVQIDRSSYAVRYEVYASNIMPVIRVVSR